MSDRGVRAGRFGFGGRAYAYLSVAMASSIEDAALTRAEVEVARLAAAGRSNAAIARARAVSVRTVANQLASIYRKLGITSRAELAVRICG